ADRLGPDDFHVAANEKYMAFQGGCYADYLPDWLDVLGTERVRVVWFEDLVAEPEQTLAGVAGFLGLDPALPPDGDPSAQHRTTGFRSAWFQRIALTGNDRLERVFRRHPATKQRVRAFYYRLNGRTPHDVIPEHVLDELAARYEGPNRRLAAVLREAGLPPAP